MNRWLWLEFTTGRDGQTAMAVHVLQGERELVSDCRSLARFELRGIPAMVAGAAKIRVTFQVDADGLLGVTARELGSGVEASIQVKPSYGLTDTEISGMLKESFENAAHDKNARALQEQRVDAERLLETVRSALQADADALLTEQERAVIEERMSALDTVRKAEDINAIARHVQQLNHATNEFAARRLDATVKTALAGRQLNDMED